MAHTSLVLSLLLLAVVSASAVALQSLDLREHGLTVSRRASNGPLSGYLGAFFLGDVPSVYLYLSNANDAVSIRALNKGSPVIKPTKGTGGVRDPAIVRGGGADEGRRWFIVGTDLNIGKVGCFLVPP